MIRKFSLAFCAAALTLVLAVPGALGAGGTTVQIRVEGKTKTLLAAVKVHTHKGWIRKGGTPKGACPATSAAGALNVATHRHWGAKYESGLGVEITSIFGERHTFSSPYFWEIFINDRAASKGACLLKLHRGEQLLFAVEPDNGYLYPLALHAPHSATVNHPFKVTVVWFNTGGKAQPLAGATVTGGGAPVTTDAQGNADITATHPGTIVLHATHSGAIRAAAVRVVVSG